METKFCYKCKQDLPIESFSLSRSKRDGRADGCRECRKKLWYDLKSRKANDTEWMMRYRWRQFKAHCKNDGRPCNPTLEEYSNLIKNAGGKCEICGKPGPLHIDHNHATQKLRGVLCVTCNNLMGFFKDNPEIFRKAANYLQR